MGELAALATSFLWSFTSMQFTLAGRRIDVDRVGGSPGRYLLDRLDRPDCGRHVPLRDPGIQPGRQRLDELNRELAELRSKVDVMRHQWEKEKGSIGEVQKVRESLEAARRDRIVGELLAERQTGRVYDQIIDRRVENGNHVPDDGYGAACRVQVRTVGRADGPVCGANAGSFGIVTADHGRWRGLPCRLPALVRTAHFGDHRSGAVR
mgnify:CR=1 FL=1